ncbi:hypothetical protein PROFUN_03048 [Planoprotostelium fungivorum]|uniref:Uncharacterized protein n=1 Tax=Planoprotostelium fungivorum TaxID=1890364 RepID=A0A2P6NQ24_9EUKA|nr:hypothetical protein PROFUN_03048 [Planoprotostelium fungivorum]
MEEEEIGASTSKSHEPPLPSLGHAERKFRQTRQINTVNYREKTDKRKALLDTWQGQGASPSDQPISELPTTVDQVITNSEGHLIESFRRISNAERVAVGSPDLNRDSRRGQEQERFVSDIRREIKKMDRDTEDMVQVFDDTKSAGRQLIDRTSELNSMANYSFKRVRENDEWKDRRLSTERLWKSDLTTVPNRPSPLVKYERMIFDALKHAGVKHLIWALVFFCLILRAVYMLFSSLFDSQQRQKRVTIEKNTESTDALTIELSLEMLSVGTTEVSVKDTEADVVVVVSSLDEPVTSSSLTKTPQRR